MSAITAVVHKYDPEATFDFGNGEIYENVNWSNNFNKPSKSEFDLAVVEEQNKIDLLECHAKRAAEYPPVTDYLDGIVKGDQSQVDKYIADCLAVKAKYPKPQ